MDIHYQIEFFSDWHCGSGLAAGANVDALVIKDKQGFPFIPGKTLKGLIREAIEEIAVLQKSDKGTIINKVLGYFSGREEEKRNNSDGDNDIKAIKGEAFFTNAELTESQKKIIISNKLEDYLYRDISSTAINENGIADPQSLRRIETVVPCILEADILNVDEELKTDIESAFGYIKRMGQNRNRGLGRCKIAIIEKEVKGGTQ